MPLSDDGIVDVPTVCLCEEEKMADIDPVIAKVLDQGFAAGAVRRADGADHYAENLRYDYLEGKNTVSFMEGTGQRLVTEAGSGRTRAETNNPAGTGAGAGNS